jgi:CDGSH-type Zn-finger protein/nitrite reductase/ring-hydroxylating ferredoxin subunit
MGDDPNEAAEIHVVPDGPYRVGGAIPLREKRILYSEYEESLTWRTDSLIPTDAEYELCRCGNSDNKPFCDGSHERTGFDGTETASDLSYAERSRAYPGTGIVVHDYRELCVHAAFCTNRLTDVWKLSHQTEDTVLRSQMIGMIERCPSGALSYEIDEAINEPDLPREISVVADGPLWVTGGIPVIRSDGTALEVRNRVTLCRCGRSGNKPLCDGSHKHSEERAASPEPKRGSTEGSLGRIVTTVDEVTVTDSLAVAVSLALVASSPLDILYTGAAAGDQDRVLEEVSAWVLQSGIAAEGLTTGVAPDVDSIAAVAEEVDAGLIVVGRGGPKPTPAVHRLAHRAPCDLLVIGDADRDLRRLFQRILIATDGSPTADRAARRGYHLGRLLGSSVDLVFVGHPATGRIITEDTIAVYGEEVPTQVDILTGDAAGRIVRAAHTGAAQLVVVGNKGLTGLRGSFLDSVPKKILDGVTGDVLICRTVRQAGSQLEPGEGGIIERHGEALAAYVDDRGELHTMSARCTHLGCVVEWNSGDKTFDCPCHGSRFGPSGEVVAGPASRPLPPA